MSFFAKKKLSYYKDYKSDIWGLVRNSLQNKIDRTLYNIGDILEEARYTKRQGFFKRQYYRWHTFIVFNTILSRRVKRHWEYYNFIHENRVKSVFYFYLLFSFFKVQVNNRLYNMYKIFFRNKKRFFNRRFYYVPFIYEPRIYNIIHKKIKKSAKYLSLQLVRLFYIMYSYKQLKQLIKKAKRSNKVFENKFISLMECKLPSFIYRSSFFSNMFESINFVKNGNLLINKYYSSNIYRSIKIMDFVGFSIFLKGFIYWTFFKRLRRKAFMFIFPKYMYISLIFFFIILIRIPIALDIINPVYIDMYRASHYT